MSETEFPRQFVAPGDALESWSTIEPYFDDLRDRPLDSTAELEAWLIHYSELIACIDEVGTDRHVKMTCQTDDADRKAAFLDFIENIDPKVKPRAHELDVRYVNCPLSRDLPPDRYAVLDRRIRAQVEMFREENVPLQTAEARLSQRYQEICGAQTVRFDGRELTLQQLAPYAERPDRSIRQAAWEAATRRRLEDREELEELFDQLVELRHDMAVNADCSDYREYAFKVKQRFDYTPQDCVALHQSIERTAVPLSRELDDERREALGLDLLRPWDLAVDVKGRGPLEPFRTVDELCEKATRVFRRVDPELAGQFEQMRERRYLDLDSRKGKAPGGYQATYEEARHPFIFMNAVGVERDVSTLLHEGGHAFHCLAARHDPLLAYRSSPIEFAEVASMGMELLALESLGEFYEGADFDRARRRQLEGIIGLFPWVATIDAFQHFLYTNPAHSRDARRAEWLRLHDRFGGLADYTGYEQELGYAWHRQLHLFQVPFYYVEYAIAQLGALQVWNNARSDFARSVARYRHALSLGGTRPLPELFRAAGAEFDFSQQTLGPLMDSVSRALRAS